MTPTVTAFAWSYEDRNASSSFARVFARTDNPVNSKPTPATTAVAHSATLPHCTLAPDFTALTLDLAHDAAPTGVDLFRYRREVKCQPWQSGQRYARISDLGRF